MCLCGKLYLPTMLLLLHLPSYVFAGVGCCLDPPESLLFLMLDEPSFFCLFTWGLCYSFCLSWWLSVGITAFPLFFFSLYMRAQNYWTSWDLNLPVPPGCLLRSLFNGSSAVLSVSPTLHSKGYEKHRQESWPFLLLQIAVLYREAHNSRSFPLDENS